MRFEQNNPNENQIQNFFSLFFKVFIFSVKKKNKVEGIPTTSGHFTFDLHSAHPDIQYKNSLTFQYSEGYYKYLDVVISSDKIKILTSIIDAGIN